MSTRMKMSWLLACAISVLGMNGVWAGDVTIDASKAVNVRLPVANGDAVAFKTSDGKDGWVRQISNEALPTPAYGKGHIFTGGGYSSRIFSSLDASTGKTVWSKSTQDNGPTSPVVTEKYVAYNSESCHTEVRDIEDGGLAWSEVTGGTLLTQPLVYNDVLVIPHPIMARQSQYADNHFRMLSVSLQNFHKGWDADMTTDVLSAPVAAAGYVFFSCTDGRLFCISNRTGGEEWHAVAKATCAPVVIGKTVAVTMETTKNNNQVEVGIQRYEVADGTLKDEKPLAPTLVNKAPAKFAGAGREGMVNPAGWDYQGPKIAYANNRLFNAPGNVINAVNLEDGKIAWRGTVVGNGLQNAADTLTSPALGKENLYLGSRAGHVLAIKQSDGTLTSAYKFSETLTTQPILADGNIYFGTTPGKIVCLKLGDKDADGWSAWGGNAGHNKTE